MKLQNSLELPWSRWKAYLKNWVKGNTVYAAGHTLPPESNTDDLYFGRELTGDYQSLCNGLKKREAKSPKS